MVLKKQTHHGEMRVLQNVAKPLIIAHRGYKAKYPENTLSSFKAALYHHAAMVELDVTLSNDRKLVVIHDETVDRTTNGSGNVCDYTLSELKNLDAGSWFSEKFKGEPLPSLYEVLNLCAGKTLVNIEIKPEAVAADVQTDSIEFQVLDLVKAFSMTDSVLISSFEPRVIERISALNRSKPKTAFLAENPLDDKTLNFMVKHQVFSYNPDYRTLSHDQIQTVHTKGIMVFTYTVNSRNDAEKCFSIGVDGIFTDHLELMV